MKPNTQAVTPQTRVTCGKYHDGNNHLTFGARATWQCDGCGEHYTRDEVREIEKSAPYGIPAKIGRGVR